MYIGGEANCSNVHTIICRTGTAQPALAGLLKASLLDALRGQLQPANSGGAGIPLTLLGNLLSWHVSSTSSTPAGLTRDWQLVATTLLGWAPKAVIDRLNQLSSLPHGTSRQQLLVHVCDVARGEWARQHQSLSCLNVEDGRLAFLWLPWQLLFVKGRSCGKLMCTPTT